MKKLFEIGIGLDEETKTYIATVGSVTDNQIAQVSSTSMRTTLVKLSKLLRAKTRVVKNFPMPEPRRILTISDNKPSIILVGANGRS
jgi:hypothetical protein